MITRALLEGKNGGRRQRRKTGKQSNKKVKENP
jgi:hypothetical protein